MRTVALIMLFICCFGAEGASWPDIPDPYGLGQRLALIQALRDRGVTIPDGASDTLLIKLYADSTAAPREATSAPPAHSPTTANTSADINNLREQVLAHELANRELTRDLRTTAKHLEDAFAREREASSTIASLRETVERQAKQIQEITSSNNALKREMELLKAAPGTVRGVISKAQSKGIGATFVVTLEKPIAQSALVMARLQGANSSIWLSSRANAGDSLLIFTAETYDDTNSALTRLVPLYDKP